MVQTGQAQTPPIDFLCVGDDTLRWEMPTNPCGPFLDYTIYYSNNINGPYSVLETLTDINTTEYYHTNANSANNIWYYYLVAHHDCPGTTPSSSDTLDNRDPDFPPIDAVTVVNGEVLIQWTPSQAPETAGYIILRLEEDGSLTTVDTIYPETQDSYLDTTAMPNIQSETYTILSLDACGNTSIFNSQPQSTIFLEVEVNPCNQTAALTWDTYQNWPEGIQQQEVWLSENGGPAERVAILPATFTRFDYPDLNDGSEYCFTVQAIRGNGIHVAASNTLCLQAEVTQPIRNFTLQSAGLLPDGSVQLIWQWDSNAEIKQVNIHRWDGSQYVLHSSYTPVLPLSTTDTFYVLDHQAQLMQEDYYIETVDDCDSTAVSNIGSTIFLSGEAQAGFINALEWTPSTIEGGEVIQYRLYKEYPSGYQLEAFLEEGSLSYQDLLDISQPNDGRACYYVEAFVSVPLPDGTLTYGTSRSNILCLEQFATIQFPNAFAPEGKNPVFKPLVTFPSTIASYQLQIFDRWGKRIFTSRQYDTGWDGRLDGKPAQAGAYVYLMEMVQTDGKREERKGSLYLLR